MQVRVYAYYVYRVQMQTQGSPRLLRHIQEETSYGMSCCGCGELLG